MKDYKKDIHEILMDLNRGRLSVSDAYQKIIEIQEKTKEYDKEYKKPSKWIKLSDRVPTVAEVGKKFIIYNSSFDKLLIANISEMEFVSSWNLENLYWKKIDLPEA